MNNLKVRFEYNGTLTQNDRKDAAILINKTVESAFEQRSTGNQYHRLAEKLLATREADIKKQLITHCQNQFNGVDFVNAEFGAIEINPKDELLVEHELDYTWETKFEVKSAIYNCIEISSDEIIVYKEGDNKIKFIDPNGLILFVEEPIGE